MDDRRTRWLLPVSVALLAANLRPALASVGPVLGELRARLHLSSAAGSLLTTIPLICFGLLAPAAPALGRRYGIQRVLGAVLATIAAGLCLRVSFGAAGLFLLTVPVASAIALANVLVPALIKRDFPGRVGLMMGVYTTAVSAAAAVAAGVTAPLDRGLGWGARGALAIWAAPALLALLLWLPRLAGPPPAAPAKREDRDPAPTRRAWAPLLRTPLAWHVTAFMGLQSLGFYATLTWLPSVYIDHGYHPEAAGLLLSVCSAVSAPVSLVVPTLAVRALDQRGLVAVSCALVVAGFAGVLLAPVAAPYLWVLLLGVGQGALFALALTLVVLRSADSDTAARLSAMSQSFGYLIAAGGPLLVGVIRDTAGWSPALGLLLALLVPQLLTGLAAARPRLLGDRQAQTSQADATGVAGS